MTEDERAIRELIETWMQESRNGNTAAVLALMTEDVVFLTPGREPFGKAEFAAASEGMRGMRIDGQAEILELQVLGDWAFLRNRLDIAVTTPDGKSTRRAGHTLTLVRKEGDGRWRLCRDANLVA